MKRIIYAEKIKYLDNEGKLIVEINSNNGDIWSFYIGSSCYSFPSLNKILEWGYEVEGGFNREDELNSVYISNENVIITITARIGKERFISAFINNTSKFFYSSSDKRRIYNIFTLMRVLDLFRKGN